MIPRIARHRRLVAAGLLWVIAWGACGVPLFPWVRKDLSQPFPCQSCCCACRNADSCWRRCCCLSDTQKLAWARAHGVQPPTFVVARLAQSARLVQSAGSTLGDASMTRSLAATASTAATSRCAHCAPAKTRTAVTSLVLAWSEGRCQGQQAVTAVLASALPWVAPRPWAPADSWVWRSDVKLPRVGSPSYEPASPPPRHEACCAA